MIGRGSPVVTLSGFFLWLSLSSRRSCDQMEGVGRQNWARGRIPIFRKIHLYGKSVKSTHGHTKKKPTQPFFRDLAVFQLPRLPYTERTYPTAKGPTLHRRNGPTIRRKDLPCTEGTDLPCAQRTDLPPRDGTYPKNGPTLRQRTYPTLKK